MGIVITPEGFIKPRYISAQQKAFVESSAKYPAFFSGYAGGKTWAGSTKVLLNTLHRYAGKNGLIVAPQHQDLQTICIPEVVARFEEAGYDLRYHGGKHYLYFNMDMGGGETREIHIHCRTGKKPESIVGIEVAWAWIDEAALIPAGVNPTRHVKKKVIGRVRGIDDDDEGEGQLFITTTHEGDMTWVYEDWIETPKKNHVHFQGSTFDNQYRREFARELVEQYDAKMVEQYVKGNAVNLFGAIIYYCFSGSDYPDGNVDGTISLDPKLPVCLSMDFNAVPGIHGVVAQHHTAQDELWILDEIHRKGMMIPGLILEYEARYASGKTKPMTMVYGDPAGRARDTSIGETSYGWVQKCMNEAKLVCVIKTPEASPLREDRFISANAGFYSGGKRHVRIHPRCKKLIRDLKTVQRDEFGKLDKKQEAQGMVHMSDAATYFIHTVRPINRTTVASLIAGR